MLEIKNGTKSYGDKKILENISLKIEPKRLVAITGDSGTGKSTLTLILGGISKLDEGEFYYNQTLINSAKQREQFRYDKIGYILQSYGVINNLTVLENIGLHQKVDKNKVYDICLNLGIEEYINTKVKFLSGGQKQRVAIARAIYKDCEIIICDEPTGNLDNNTRDKILEVLKELKKTIIIVTHDSVVANMCDVIYKIENRKLILKEEKI